MARRPGAGSDYRPALFLCFFTGWRQGEVAKLLWGDLRLETPSPYIQLRAKVVKNSQEGAYPLMRHVANYLRLIRPADATPDTPVLNFAMPSSSQFQRDVERAGVAYRRDDGDADFHALRHGFATWLAEREVEDTVRQKLLRHLTPDITARYTHVRKAIETAPVIDLQTSEDWSALGTGGTGAEGPVRSRSGTIKVRPPDSQFAFLDQLTLFVKKWGHGAEDQPPCPLH